MRRVVAALIASLACASLGTKASDAQPAQLVIPVLLPLTGSAAFIGQGQATSLRVLESTVNAHGGVRGRPVHFDIEDDQSSPANAVQFANALLARHAPLIVGPAFTPECAAVAPLIKGQAVMYCTSPGLSPAPESTIYSAGIAGPDYSKLLLRYFFGRGWKRIAVISSTDASGQNFENSLLDAIAQPAYRDAQLVDREHFNTSDLSVNAQLVRIKAANPQAVIEWTAGTSFATLLRGTKEVGIDVPIAGGNGNMTYAQMAQYAGFLPRILLFPAVSGLTPGAIAKGPLRDAQDVYFAAFKAAGLRPDFQNNIVWDPAVIIIHAYRSIGPDATVAQLQDFLQHLHSWVGVNGVYDFRDGSQRGITINAGNVAQWDPASKEFMAVSRLGGFIR